MPKSDLATVIDHVASCMMLLKEDGFSELEISQPLPVIEGPALPSAPQGNAFAKKEIPKLNFENSNLFLISCPRLEQREDKRSKEESLLGFVAEKQHFEEPYLSTLVKIVKAMGYELNTPEACTAEALGHCCAVISMGQVAFDCLSGSKKALALARGKIIQHEGLTILPIFSPDFFQNNTTIKKEIWKDLQGLLKRLGLQLPPK